MENNDSKSILLAGIDSPCYLFDNDGSCVVKLVINNQSVNVTVIRSKSIPNSCAINSLESYLEDTATAELYIKNPVFQKVDEHKWNEISKLYRIRAQTAKL